LGKALEEVKYLYMLPCSPIIMSQAKKANSIFEAMGLLLAAGFDFQYHKEAGLYLPKEIAVR
jgi:hypothetical protein